MDHLVRESDGIISARKSKTDRNADIRAVLIDPALGAYVAFAFD